MQNTQASQLTGDKSKHHINKFKEIHVDRNISPVIYAVGQLLWSGRQAGRKAGRYCDKIIAVYIF